MKITIHGIHDHRLTLALSRLLQAYRPYTEKIDGEVVFQLTTLVSEEKVKAFLRMDSRWMEEEKRRTTPAFAEHNVLTYTVLTVVYKALSHLTGKQLPWGL